MIGDNEEAVLRSGDNEVDEEFSIVEEPPLDKSRTSSGSACLTGLILILVVKIGVLMKEQFTAIWGNLKLLANILKSTKKIKERQKEVSNKRQEMK